MTTTTAAPVTNTQTSDEKRRELIKAYRTNEKDSGSPEIQIALLTDRINSINEHLRKARKDHSSRRGLLILVGRRNRLLKYLMRTNHEGYKKLIQALGLRK